MTEVRQKCLNAKQAALAASSLATQRKNEALVSIADALLAHCDAILQANAEDMQNGISQRMDPSILDRLLLTPERIQNIAKGVRQVVDLPDPIGEVLSETRSDNGLLIRKVRVPLGLIGIIYEARPNVTVDATALALKTGNAIVLRGSSSALSTNMALVKVMKGALVQAGLDEQLIQIIENTDHEAAMELMHMNGVLDVLIPRGGEGLIQHVMQNATVPVIETGIGNCHIYVDPTAPIEMALPVIVNSKISRPSVCNSAEKLLIHKNWPTENIAAVLEALSLAGVELRCDERIRALFPDNDRLKVLPAEDYTREYLDMIMGVMMIDDVQQAITHINTYGSHHTDAILCENPQTTSMFMESVDSAAVNHNASTRFTDGFVFGFGAEIGISTQKLHARGPMGLPELTSSKYMVFGDGQIR